MVHKKLIKRDRKHLAVVGRQLNKEKKRNPEKYERREKKLKKVDRLIRNL